MPIVHSHTKPSHTRAVLAGSTLVLAGLSVAAGGLARLIPSATPPGALMRIFDPLAHVFLGLGGLLGLIVVLLGLRRTGAATMILAVGFTVELWYSHRSLSLPLARDMTPEIRILFFNALESNVTSADRIVDATLTAAPDVVVFAEAAAIRPALARLQAEYAFVSPCNVERCELVVATRIAPTRFWTLQLNPIWHDRYAVLEIQTNTGEQLFLAASHLTKPWFNGVAESEVERLGAQYNWLSGPVVAVGDFNMTPWSRPMRQLLSQTGMRTLRSPLATWPARAGRFGLPIDHILVRGGTRVVWLLPFGAELDSNHRGLVAGIAVGDERD